MFEVRRNCEVATIYPKVIRHIFRFNPQDGIRAARNFRPWENFWENCVNRRIRRYGRKFIVYIHIEKFLDNKNIKIQRCVVEIAKLHHKLHNVIVLQSRNERNRFQISWNEVKGGISIFSVFCSANSVLNRNNGARTKLRISRYSIDGLFQCFEWRLIDEEWRSTT